MFPLVVLGLLSIIYWVLSGDLSIYAFVQFYPMVCVPVVLLVFNKKNFSVRGYWLLLMCYVLAKLLETYDHEIYHFTGLVGGHPLKHLAAAMGVLLFAKYMKK